VVASVSLGVGGIAYQDTFHGVSIDFRVVVVLYEYKSS
jgi:hypothetical protein